ncbi:hypothetical protein FNV43_RR02543 [Rhamnella rubrinervis]|uniref:Uncharacterized protein n=1 Tax=Rhamnella rubrinervis TaxID=2594499 RepID=A0A8K0MTU4_9ROSA|nr:hypothetical protein FNV43_RR02543 [Rhamnella rubrinervis]
MARALECPKTAYMPVANAAAIAAMENMVRRNDVEKCDKLLVLSCFRAKRRWIKTAELENTMAMVYDIMNALNAVFFLRIAAPGSGLSSLT